MGWSQVRSFSLPTGEVKGHRGAKGPGGDELSAPPWHGKVNPASICGDIALGLELAYSILIL